MHPTDPSLSESRFKAFANARKARADATGDILFKPAVMPIKSHEEIFCDTYFGGMKLENVIAILKSHSPEYFV